MSTSKCVLVFRHVHISFKLLSTTATAIATTTTMNVHTGAIPATAALVSGDNRDQTAPAIGVNDLIGNQSEHARHEWEMRKRLRATGDGVGVVDSTVVQAIETTEAQSTLGLHNGNNAAVLAAIAALTAEMAAQRTAHTTAIAALTAQMNAQRTAHTTAIAALTAQTATLVGRIANMRAVRTTKNERYKQRFCWLLYSSSQKALTNY
jgi:hypothetical protein